MPAIKHLLWVPATYIKLGQLMGSTPESERQRPTERAAAAPGWVGRTAILSMLNETRVWPGQKEDLEGHCLVNKVCQ